MFKRCQRQVPRFTFNWCWRSY